MHKKKEKENEGGKKDRKKITIKKSIQKIENDELPF